jgi:hypothetical protein
MTNRARQQPGLSVCEIRNQAARLASDFDSLNARYEKASRHAFRLFAALRL